MSITLNIFDFDDTLAKSDAVVRVTHANGDISELTSDEFAKYVPDDGDEYNFDDFEIYPVNGQPIKSSFKKLNDAISAGGINNTVILTARSNGTPVKEFLVDHGIDPSINVMAVGSNNPLDKALYVQDRIFKDGYTHVHVFEDNIKNIDAISAITKKNNVGFSYTLVATESRNPLAFIKKYVRNILIEIMKNNKEDKPPGAGFIVLKKIEGRHHVLGLKINGAFDLPKGQLDPGEDTLEAAIRETYEESGISELNFRWGLKSLKVNHLTLYVAETSQEPFIAPNPETGEYEHESAHWLSWDEMERGIKPYMRGALIIAKNIVEGS